VLPKLAVLVLPGHAVPRTIRDLWAERTTTASSAQFNRPARWQIDCRDLAYNNKEVIARLFPGWRCDPEHVSHGMDVLFRIPLAEAGLEPVTLA
jgi:hypothetical protein